MLERELEPEAAQSKRQRAVDHLEMGEGGFKDGFITWDEKFAMMKRGRVESLLTYETISTDSIRRLIFPLLLRTLPVLNIDSFSHLQMLAQCIFTSRGQNLSAWSRPTRRDSAPDLRCRRSPPSPHRHPGPPAASVQLGIMAPS